MLAPIAFSKKNDTERERGCALAMRGLAATTAAALALGVAILAGTSAAHADDAEGGEPEIVLAAEEAPEDFSPEAPEAPEDAPMNTAPVAVDDFFAIAKNAQTIFQVKANDTDAESWILIDGFTTPSHGTIYAVDPAAGTFKYQPASNYQGYDSFTYRVRDADGLYSEYATVTIAIGNVVNTAPVAVDDVYFKPLGTHQIGNVLANDTDIDGDTLSVSWTPPAIGTFSGNVYGDFDWQPPSAQWTGTVQIPYTVSDGKGGTDAGLVTITTLQDLIAPVAVADAYSVKQGAVLVVDAASGLLANDSDPDSTTLSVMAFTGSLDGVLDLDATTGAFTFTPAAGFLGQTSFHYRLLDPAGHVSDFVDVTFTVTTTNQAPVAAADAYTVQEGQTLVIDAAAGLLANDSDPDGDPIAFDSSTTPMNGTVTITAGGAFVYTPNAGFLGTDHFYYSVKDIDGAASALAEVTVEVTADAMVEHAPEGIQDDYLDVLQGTTLTIDAAAGLLANDIDIDGDALVIDSYTQPVNGTITAFDLATGAFTYVGDRQQTSGIDWFQYVAKDPSGLSTSMVTVRIHIVPNAAELPVAGADAYWTTPGTQLVVAAPKHLLANDTDPNGDAFTVRAYGQPQHGTVTDFDFATGSFTWTPDAGYVGDDTMHYNLEDANGFVTEYFQVALHVVETLPVDEPVEPSQPAPASESAESPESGSTQGGAAPAPTAEVEVEHVVERDARGLLEPVLEPSAPSKAATDDAETTGGTTASAATKPIAGMPTWVAFVLAALGAVAAATVGIVRGLRARSNAERS